MIQVEAEEISNAVNDLELLYEIPKIEVSQCGQGLRNMTLYDHYA